MWEPQRLTPLWAFTAWYRDSFTFTFLYSCKTSDSIIMLYTVYCRLYYKWQWVRFLSVRLYYKWQWVGFLSVVQHYSYFVEVVDIECFMSMSGTERTLSVHWTHFLILLFFLGYLGLSSCWHYWLYQVGDGFVDDGFSYCSPMFCNRPEGGTHLPKDGAVDSNSHLLGM
jgi:hypothetical protein